ncbi:MAG: LysR family transcriptional regulator [Rhodobacteraceae bacterium]|jgi:DNA-binding transcriptional LysR family regulator|nr:LysR family transcriptional regulator [Paracoccaceae bacterium]
MKIDPRHLSQLSLIIEAGSFQAAADRLGLTQPALSRNIRVLEERFGAPLFDRTTRKAQPTPMGVRLAEMGHSVRIAEEQASVLSSRATSGTIGEVRIGAPPLIAGHFLTRRISSFLREFNGCHVELRVGVVHELYTMLEHGQIDLAIAPRKLTDKGADISFTFLVDDRLGIMCRRDHPLVRHENPRASDLERQIWVAHSRRGFLRIQTESALLRMGVETIRVGFETDSPQAAMEIVASSDMITAMPKETTRPYLDDGLVFLAMDHPHFSRPLGLIQRSDGPKNQAVANFAQHLVSSCAEI